MKEKRNHNQLFSVIFVLFNAFMIYYFIRSFLYPVETNFWLIHSGVPLLLMEFIFIFIILIFIRLILKAIPKKGTIFVISLAFLFALTTSITFHNFMLFLFFIGSILSKFLLIKISKDNEKESYLYLYGLIATLFVLSAFLALIFSGIGNYFPEQEKLLSKEIIPIVPSDNMDAPAFFSAFGVLYYILLIAFHRFDLEKFSEKQKEKYKQTLITRGKNQ
jgi:hypothetical protein